MREQRTFEHARPLTQREVAANAKHFAAKGYSVAEVESPTGALGGAIVASGGTLDRRALPGYAQGEVEAQ